jgi:hypothetical protein
MLLSTHTLVAFVLALSTASAQSPLERRSVFDLSKRQGGQAFQPGSTPTTCAPADTCGTDWCLDRPRGDICCSEGCKLTYNFQLRTMN